MPKESARPPAEERSRLAGEVLRQPLNHLHAACQLLFGHEFIGPVCLGDVSRAADDAGEAGVGKLARLGGVGDRSGDGVAGELFDEIDDGGILGGVEPRLVWSARGLGTGRLGALLRVVLPAALPAVLSGIRIAIAVSIFAFHVAWGEVLFASVMTNDNTRTLAIGLQDYATRSDVYWNQLMAASLVVSVPVVAAFLAVQRYLVSGMTAGGVKG